MMRSYHEGHRTASITKPLITIPKEIDLESMTQLSWGVTRAVADINAYDRRMHMLLSGRNSGSASPRPGEHHGESSKRISKRKKKPRRALSRVVSPVFSIITHPQNESAASALHMARLLTRTETNSRENNNSKNNRLLPQKKTQRETPRCSTTPARPAGPSTAHSGDMDLRGCGTCATCADSCTRRRHNAR